MWQSRRKHGYSVIIRATTPRISGAGGCAKPQQRCKDKYVGTLVAAQVQQADLIVISKSALNPDFRLQTLQPSIDANDQDAMEVVLGWGSERNHGQSIPPNLAPSFLLGLGKVSCLFP